MDYSPYLADIKALATSIGTDELALEIIRKARPDILNSQIRIRPCQQMGQQPGIEMDIQLYVWNLKRIHEMVSLFDGSKP